MAIKTRLRPLGELGANCYLITDLESGEAAVVDPGIYNEKTELLLKNTERVKYILLTHGHFDHMLGVPGVKKNFGGEVCIHALDADCFERREKSMIRSGMEFDFPIKADIALNGGDRLKLGETEFTVLHTPGHTEGSACFLFPDALFTGDTVFHGTVGRTDFLTGSVEEIMQSIKKISELDGDFVIYPGHGLRTSLEIEKRTNPYFINAGRNEK